MYRNAESAEIENFSVNKHVNNSSDFNNMGKLDFDDRWSSYNCGSRRKLDKDILNAERVGLAMSSLNTNKAAGINGSDSRAFNILSSDYSCNFIPSILLYAIVWLCASSIWSRDNDSYTEGSSPVWRIILNISGVSLLAL
jgi:hypothetical protein